MSPNDRMMSVRIPLELAVWIEKQVDEQNVSTSTFVRGVLEAERKRSVSEITEYVHEAVVEALFNRREVDCVDKGGCFEIVVRDYVPDHDVAWTLTKKVVEETDRDQLVDLFREGVFRTRVHEDLLFFSSNEPQAEKYRKATGQRQLEVGIIDNTPFAEEVRKE